MDNRKGINQPWLTKEVKDSIKLKKIYNGAKYNGKPQNGEWPTPIFYVFI